MNPRRVIMLVVAQSMPLLVRDVLVEDTAAIVAIMNPIIAAGVYAAFDTACTATIRMRQ